MTSGPDHSITGISLPKWMKTKISDRAYDFEENAFSPPTGDDGFFLIRYKKPSEESTQSCPKVTTAPKYTPISSLFEVKKDVDLTKHTNSCQEFIPNAKIFLLVSPSVGLMPANVIQQGTVKRRLTLPGDRPARKVGPPSSGPPWEQSVPPHHSTTSLLLVCVCDDFVLLVQTSMGPSLPVFGNVLGKLLSPREIGIRNGAHNGLLKSTGIDDGFKGEGAACGYSVVAVAHQMIADRKSGPDELVIPKSQRVRRNSKSLPSSPLSSPKLLRKNPYFTSILFGSNERVSALKGSPSESSSEDLVGRAASEDGSPLAANPRAGRVLKAKPSELREMNFWSPTSM